MATRMIVKTRAPELVPLRRRLQLKPLPLRTA
jgi:hypothetical protein